MTFDGAAFWLVIATRTTFDAGEEIFEYVADNTLYDTEAQAEAKALALARQCPLHRFTVVQSVATCVCSVERTPRWHERELPAYYADPQRRTNDEHP